jgi:hypothetical protein
VGLDVDFNLVICDINNMRNDNKKGDFILGHMKSWLMEHDECIGDAIENGATSLEQVIQYCKTNMVMIDDTYIKEQWDIFMAGPDPDLPRLTDDEILDLDNEYLNEQEHNFGDVL